MLAILAAVRTTYKAIVPLALSTVLVLGLSSGPSAVRAADGDAIRNDLFRAELGYPPASSAFALEPASPTSEGKWGLPLTFREEIDLDRRADLQEQLGEAQELVASDPVGLGGSWLDQRGGDGRGFVFTVGFVGTINRSLLEAIVAATPEGVEVRPVVVNRSMADLEKLAAGILLEDRKSDIPLGGVSIAPQFNAVVVHTADGRLRPGMPAEGVLAAKGELSPTSCNPAERCTYRPFRGGLQIQDKYQSGGNTAWWQCTSGFFARRYEILVMLTAAHCQRSYWDDVVYGRDHTDPIGGWGPDTTPPWSWSCATYCDIDVELQVMDEVTSYPTSKNLIYFDAANKSRAITQLRNYGSSWVGSVVCLSGVATNTSCGTITSIGTACCVNMPKEGYQARINKGAFTTAVTAEGDSGGPVTNTYVAYGIVTAKYNSSGNLFFSSLSPGLSQLSATLCTTSGC